jgi:hypothetical protein
MHILECLPSSRACASYFFKLHHIDTLLDTLRNLILFVDARCPWNSLLPQEEESFSNSVHSWIIFFTYATGICNYFFTQPETLQSSMAFVHDQYHNTINTTTVPIMFVSLYFPRNEQGIRERISYVQHFSLKMHVITVKSQLISLFYFFRSFFLSFFLNLTFFYLINISLEGQSTASK